MFRRTPPVPVGAALSLALIVAACGGSGGSTIAPTAGGATPGQGASAATPAPSFDAQPGAITLVAYSTPREAYDQLITDFGSTAAGKDVAFETSYGASGDQRRAVEAGLPADYVAFSLEPDMSALVKDGIVAADWNGNQYKGMVTDSVVVLVVRKGNPKGIRTWDDLIKPGVGVIEPNPFTSGGARWNVMAAYGAEIKAGKTEDQAVQYLKDLFKNVVVQDKSAREALATFVTGQGDVMLAYENEAITAQQKGEDLEYIVPAQTILIENPVAVTVKGGDASDKARAFLDYVVTPEAQKVFGEKGYRPVDTTVLATFTNFPAPAGLFTIRDVGGWTDVSTRFFDKTKGIVAGIERDLGIEP